MDAVSRYVGQSLWLLQGSPGVPGKGMQMTAPKHRGPDVPRPLGLHTYDTREATGAKATAEGAALRVERNRRHLSASDAARILCMRAVDLVALEQGTREFVRAGALEDAVRYFARHAEKRADGGTLAMPVELRR